MLSVVVKLVYCWSVVLWVWLYLVKPCGEQKRDCICWNKSTMHIKQHNLNAIKNKLMREIILTLLHLKYAKIIFLRNGVSGVSINLSRSWLHKLDERLPWRWSLIQHHLLLLCDDTLLHVLHNTESVINKGLEQLYWLNYMGECISAGLIHNVCISGWVSPGILWYVITGHNTILLWFIFFYYFFYFTMWEWF